ncbi:MAG TPA: hypothetical protein VEF89_15160 [Solirubrobacteraceae bacterium]|nr:hypothetical protein [Solirubrobacteraceae bacterium]
MVFQIMSGPLAGKYWYWSEEIIPNVGVGQTVAAGQTVATFAPSRTGIKIGGWAANPGRPRGGWKATPKGMARPPARTSGTCLSSLERTRGMALGVRFPPTVGTTLHAEP